MKRRILSLLLASTVMVSVAGCSSSTKKVTETAKTTENTIDFNEAPYTISVSYPVYGAAQPDLQKVFDKVNETTLKKINAKVELKVISVANMANAYSLAAASGEKSDLISLVPGGQLFTKFISSKMIKPVDAEFDKWGKDIKAGLGDILEVGKYQGKQYGIPVKDDVVTAGAFVMLKSIVDKYNIDVTKLKTINDFDAVFEKVKANEPDLQVFFPNGFSFYLLSYDTLGDNMGVLKNGGLDDTKVVNMYETEEYVTYAKKMREWYLKGYVPKDYATSQVQPISLQNAGKLFASMNTMTFANDTLGENPAKVAVQFTQPVKRTDSLQTIMWAIPGTAQRPDKSIQLLNLAYQDKDLAKLMKYGIEGEHYDVNSDGTIDANKGLKTYRQAWSIWGDGVQYPVIKSKLVGVGGDLTKYNTLMADWNKNTKSSKALGFIFNSDSVKTEIAAITAVTEQYGKLIDGGAIDPDKELKTFNDKLYAAGLKKVMDEKQKQLDEWLKTK